MKNESIAILRSLLKCIEAGASIAEMRWSRKNNGNVYNFSIEVKTTEEIRELINSEDVSQDPNLDICPLCNDFLMVNDEYMQDTYGQVYAEYMHPETWTYFCPGCEEAGTYEQLLKESYDRKDEERYRRGE